MRLPWTQPLSDDHPTIEPLAAAHVRDLRLPWLSRFNPSSLTKHLDAHPGMSLWAPRTGEYLVAEQWRQRDDIAQLLEVVARRGKPALVHAMLDRLRGLGYRLVVISDEVWNDDAKSYGEAGFGHLEKIVYFQKDLRGRAGLESQTALPQLQYTLLTLAELTLLLELDHASFPWLWWNNHAEMSAYLRMADVHIYAAFAEGVPVGYASFTMYRDWAHLDRLAVVEGQQGRKYGAAQLLSTLQRMATLGATSVGLSTQQNNIQSQQLYKGFGFRMTQEAMNFYGARLDEC